MHVLLSCEVESCICGHHLYAEAILKGDVVVRHLQKQLSQILSLCILRNGTIDCMVTGG